MSSLTLVMDVEVGRELGVGGVFGKDVRKAVVASGVVESDPVLFVVFDVSIVASEGGEGRVEGVVGCCCGCC